MQKKDSIIDEIYAFWDNGGGACVARCVLSIVLIAVMCIRATKTGMEFIWEIALFSAPYVLDGVILFRRVPSITYSKIFKTTYFLCLAILFIALVIMVVATIQFYIVDVNEGYNLPENIYGHKLYKLATVASDVSILLNLPLVILLSVCDYMANVKRNKENDQDSC